MTVMQLGEMLCDCPVYWRNYLYDLDRIYPKPDGDAFPESVLNSGLEPFGGRYIETVDSDGEMFYGVEFPDEKRYFLFKLKYGNKEK